MGLYDWMLMWFGRFLVHAIVLLALFCVVAVGMFFAGIPTWNRQRKCPHRRVRETMACDAICINCGKNLGFIGTFRESKEDSANG